MPDPIADRATKLFEAKRNELRERRDSQAASITAKFNKAGMFHSGNRLAAVQKLYATELRVATAVAWEVLRSAHAAMGSKVSGEVRDALKEWMRHRIEALRGELSVECQGELRDPNPRGIDPSLKEPAAIELQRYDAEIDNYLDMTQNQPKPGTSIVINAQTIGAVVTGEHAVVHIKQNSEAVKQLAAALDAIRQVIPSSELAPRAKEELLEIVADADRELAKPEPNETKLLTFFTVLAASVEGIANAKPAYESIKSVLATFGVNLP